MPEPSQFNIDRTHPGRWTITFSNPPINMFLPTTGRYLPAFGPSEDDSTDTPPD